ncbi:unnamed protein product [Durusdinium trenchii]|uniref:Uncharacterized protein n=1 Tax=Durusdinium trenchii TaxID=1381693 RepID=A0ABP0RUF5_9DINO
MTDVRPIAETDLSLDEAEDKIKQMRQDRNWLSERAARKKGLVSIVVILPEGIGTEFAIVAGYNDEVDVKIAEHRVELSADSARMLSLKLASFGTSFLMQTAAWHMSNASERGRSCLLLAVLHLATLHLPADSLDRLRISPTFENWVTAFCREALEGQASDLFGESELEVRRDPHLKKRLPRRVIRLMREDPNFQTVLQADIFAQHEHDAGEPNYPECADIDQLFDRVLGELLEPYKAKRFGGELQLEEALFHSLSSTGKMLSLLTGPPASLRRSGRGATVTGTCGYHRSLQCLHSETFRYQYERCFVREYGLMAGRAYVESRCLNTSYHLVLCAIEGSILPWARIRASSKLVASSEPMYCPGLSLCRAKPSQSRSVKRPSLVASYLLLT